MHRVQAGMDGASFAKLCRETGLLGGKLSSTSVDLAFTKAKAKVSLPWAHDPYFMLLHRHVVCVSSTSHVHDMHTHCAMILYIQGYCASESNND